MKYSELIMLEQLLKKYINYRVVEDKEDILYKIKRKLIEDLAIFVNKNMEDGEEVEDVIRKRVLADTMDFIRGIATKKIKEKEQINPKELEELAREKIRNLI